ncbi:MAG: hypothetical protein V1878_02655 [bacterium]
MRHTLIFSLLIATFLLPSLAFGQDAPKMPEGLGFQKPEASWWGSLSATQREGIQDLNRRFLDEAAPLLGSLFARRIELRALWSDPKASPALIEAKEREAVDLGRQIQERALKYRLQARSLLTPEQVTQFQGGFWLFRGPGMGGPGLERERRRGPGRGGWCYPRQ